VGELGELGELAVRGPSGVLPQLAQLRCEVVHGYGRQASTCAGGRGMRGTPVGQSAGCAALARAVRRLTMKAGAARPLRAAHE
jgi:hypothetical protein